MFKCDTETTRLVEDAHARRRESHPVSDSRFERLYEDVADVIADPLIEDDREETAELFCPDGPISHVRSVEVRRVAVFIGPLNHGDELDPRRPHLVPKEAVHVKWEVAIDGIHRCQHVVFDPVLLQQAQPAHHFAEGPFALLCDPVHVVERLRTVDADSDEIVVLFEELAPLVGKEGPVGLQRVLEGHVRLAVAVL